MKNIYNSLSLIFLSTCLVFGQTGPAGVGNFDGSTGPENIIWLDASDLASFSNGGTWSDKSGNGFNAVHVGGNVPSLGTFIGGNNALRFNGVANEELVIADDDATTNKLDNSNEFAAIAVFNSGSTDTRSIISKRLNSSNRSWTLFYNNDFDMYGYAGSTTVGVNNSAGNGNVRASGNPHIASMTVDAALSSSSVKMYVNGGLVHSTGSSVSIPDRGEDVVIGLFQDGDNRYFDGDIAEIIVYRNSLNGGERTIIENYLSEKYGIIISNDFFGTAAGFDAGFINDLRGIGTEDGSEKFSRSGFSDALQVEESKNSLNANNEFILFAHDNTAHADGVTANITVDPGVLDSRWARSWYVEATGEVTTEMRFDFGTAGLGFTGDATDYVVLYRASIADDFTRIPADSYVIENGDQLVADLSNATLQTGYYTIGVGEQITTNHWYSYQTGDWNDPLTWTTISNGSLREPVTGGIPTSGDNVTILSGRTVTMDTDDNDGINLTVNGQLDIVNTTDHNFFNILGNGVISIAGDASQNDNFPSGSTAVFADSIVGGTVEIVGSGLNLDQTRLYNNVIVNLDNASSIATLLADYTLNGDLSVELGIFQVNDNASTVTKNVTVYGDVQVEASGEINVGTANARHEFNFYGNFSNSGRAEFTNRSSVNYGSEATNGIIDANFLSDVANQEINCNGTTNFYRIEIDKGDDQTYILDINSLSPSNFNLLGPADYGHGSTSQLTTNSNALGLLRGTVRLNVNVDVPVLNNTGNYNISEAARLWVNGGSAIKPGGTAIVPYGTIQLSGGILNAPVNSGITTRNNGGIIVSGGTMTVNQIRTSVEGATNIGGYIQSGGIVNVTGNNVQQDYYSFSLTYPGNTFNMSGGELRVAGADNFNDHTGGTSGQVHGGSIFINSDPGNVSVTGGTVIMENSSNIDFKVTSRAPFWNVIMRSTGGSATEVNLEAGTSGDDSPGEFETILIPSLKVLNDLTIESGVVFDHNGFNVEIASDFVIENGGDYVFDTGKKNTTTINGTDNSLLSFQNRTGGVNDEQYFWNLVIDKPTNKSVSLASGKGSVNGNDNNLLRIDGDYFKVLSGTLDQGVHSIRMYADTLVNYDVCTIFDPAVSADNQPHGENDLLKLRDDGGPATIFITADSSRFGGVKLNSGSEIIDLNSDLRIDYLEYRHGRINLDVNNLTIDRLNVILSSSETRTDEDGGGNFSVEDMFITAGNASDGGLSLYVPANGENPGFIDMSGAANTTSNPTVFFFPVGTGTTGTDADSEYTPVNIRFASATDDGYVTVKPVTKKLETAGPYPLGNDISDRYWIVDHSGFTTVPKIERVWFRSVEKDDPNGGADGFPGNFVPGYVLEDSPYTRTAEIDGGATSTSSIINSDASNIRIFFWGNEGSGNPAGGFDLINAAYTAGDPSKFTGAPQIFYNTNVGRRNWNDGTKWSSTDDGSDDGTNEYPQEGDIAIMQNYGQGNQNAWVNANIDISVARLTFNDTNGGWSPRLWVTNRTANLDLGTVDGGGTFFLEVTSAQVPTFSATTDLGLFNNTATSYFNYKIDADNQTVNMIGNISEYPNIRIEGGNGGGDDNNRILQTSVPTTVNGVVRMDRSSRFRVNHDLTIKGDLRVTWQENRCTFEVGDAREVTVTVEGNLQLEDGSGNDDSRIVVKNDNQNSYEHIFQVGGDVIIESVNGGSSAFDLYNGVAPNNNAVLRFINEDNSIFTNASSIIPELYRVEIHKDVSTASVEVTSDFDLYGSSNGPVKAIELQRGSLILNNSDIDIDLTTGNESFSIPAEAGLQITQGKVNVSGDDSGIELDGSLIIDGGTVDMDDPVNNGNNYIEYSASGRALLEISSGTLSVGSQIRPITTAETGVLKYRQTGGDVRIGTQAGPVNNRGMLQIYNTGSEFTYTGGTLVIERHQSAPSVAALFLDPDNSDVSGSTITLFNSNTPATQNDFRINSVIPLNNLTINGNNSPIALISINPLTISNQLTISSGATLNGNGRTLTIGADLVNDGAYNAQGNETIFNSTGVQQITGAGTNDFFRFTKRESGTLELTNSIVVNGLFTIAEGELNDTGFAVDLKADAVIDGTHSSSGGSGIVFSGVAAQELRRSSAGTGTVGMLTINNSNGVTVPDGNGYNFNIGSGLRLQDGVFNVGGSFIFLGINAEITPVSPFGVDNMIQTNSSFVDSGIGKQFAAGYNQNFVFPVGQAFYTPVAFNFAASGNTFGSSSGSLIVRPSNEYHPTVNDGTDVLATGDINNVLQYYWTVTASGINGLVADMTFQYDQSLVLEDEPGVNYEENDYFAARILSFNNPSNDINKFDETFVDEGNNLIFFNFNGSGSNGISGDYFAGLDEAIPNNVVTYTAVGGGGDVDQEIYDIPLPSGAGVPPSGAVVIIPSGNTVRLNTDNIRLYKTEIQSGGVLEVDNTTNHRLGALDGTGTLRIVSDGINANLPAFSGSFLSCSGGALEYAGTGSYGILPGITSLRALTLSGSGDRDFPNNNVEICENLIVNGPTVIGYNGRRIDILGDAVLVNGVINAPSGGGGRFNVFGEFTLNAGIWNGSTSGRSSFVRGLEINGGTFNVGTSNYEVYIFDYLTLNSGNFDGGSNNAKLIFWADVQPFYTPVDNIVTGDFTGSNAFQNVVVNKDNLGFNVNVIGNVQIAGSLQLTDGKIVNSNTIGLTSTATVSPVAGRSNSYITGRVAKESVTSNFTFPIGSADLWRPASVNNVSTGGLTWEAEYFQSPATSEPLVDNLTLTEPGEIATISNNEYWKISDGTGAPSGATATVGLSWGVESDVSAVGSEREELEVMLWNDGSSSWDNLGGTNFSGGHTQNGGRFTATTSNSFSEHIYTLGSGDAANPLPVTLVSFDGELVGSSVKLFWTTSSELNNDYFEIEHSTDGISFDFIGRVNGAGTSEELLNYTLYHEQPESGYHFYRLKQVDFDGASQYEGQIVSVYIEGGVKKLEMTPFPNPTVQSNLRLKVVLNKKQAKVEVIDMFGVTQYSDIIDSNDINEREYQLNIGKELKPGIYIIKVQQGLESISKRIMILDE